MGKTKNYHRINGFALPSVLIASIIMLTVLLVAVVSTAAIRVSLVSLYYNQLATNAGDAGITYAKACLGASGDVPQWSNAAPLRPNTDCTGTQLAGFTCPTNSNDVRCSVMVNGGTITTFTIGLPQLDSNGRASIIASTGLTKLIRQSDNTTWRQYTQNAIAQTNFSGIGIVTNGLVMNLDAANSISYPGRGTTWTDLSGNGNNGTLINGVGYTNANGGALTFDGVSNYVNVPNSSSILPSTGNISTLSCFKALAAGSDGGSIIFNKENEYELSAGGGNIDYAFRPNWAWVGATSFNVSQFYCVAVTYDQSYQRMYINGTPVYSAPLSGAIGNSFSNDLRIGARGAPGAASGFFNGQIATVQIYNRALSAAEVQQNFDAFSSRYSYQYAKVLVVAGGGGGGMDMGGGGGGGGVIYNESYQVASQSYPIVVGAGGSAAPAAGTNGQPTSHQYTISATSGQNSSFSGLTAIGGGYGGSSYYAYTPNYGVAGNGGSGGGVSGYSDGTVKPGGLGTSGQGYNGGQGGGQYYSGGGGGAGGAGSNSFNQPNGGIGYLSAINGTSLYWGGGGGGASYSLATGGNGGNGGGGGGAVGTTTGGSGLNPGSPGGGGVPNSQTNTPGGNAGANTGGGGGGGSHYNANNKGGDGGSGIVIISYPTNFMIASGGTITYSGGNTIHTFYSSGTFTVLSKAPRNQNIMPGFASWTLSGGAAYNSSTGQLTLGASGQATSPLVRVDKPTMMYVGGDFYSAIASANFTPNAGWLMGTAYYAADGVTPAYNWQNYAGNGCAQGFALSTWDTNDIRCTFGGGPNVVYVRYNFSGNSPGYTSTDLIIKNPRLTLTD